MMVERLPCAIRLALFNSAEMSLPTLKNIESAITHQSRSTGVLLKPWGRNSLRDITRLVMA